MAVCAADEFPALNCVPCHVTVGRDAAQITGNWLPDPDIVILEGTGVLNGLLGSFGL